MKTSQRAIKLIVTLTLTLVALGTGVLAWFSMNTRAIASGLEGYAQAGAGGFYISRSKDKDWTTELDLSDVKVLGITKKFTDITSTNGIQFTTRDGQLVNQGYLEFDLYFLTGADLVEIYLTELSMSADPTVWQSETDVVVDGRTVEPGDLLSSSLANAIRVSFEEVEGAGYEDDGANIHYLNIFEKEASQDALNGSPKLFGNTIGASTLQNNFAVQYYNAIHGNVINAVPDLTARGDQVLPEEGIIIGSTRTILVTDEVEHDFGPSYTNYAHIRVRVWVEGWDQEAFNAIMDGTVTINFTFDLLP